MRLPAARARLLPRRGARTLAVFATIERGSSCAEVIKKSRFVAFAAPASSADAAHTYIQTVSDPRANHNCYAWRLADGSQRSSGDGEPAGTAGPPILAAIQTAGLHDVVVVVTRFFGGVKLGTGGLARAYGGIASRCLRDCSTVQRAAVTSTWVRFAPGDTGAVYAALGRYNPREVQHQAGAGEISGAGGHLELQFDAPSEDVEALASALREATQGRVVVEKLPVS